MNKVSLKDFLEIFKGAVDKHKDTNDPLPEINSYSLDKIDSYLKMPFQFVFGQELYPSIYDKASILIYIFIKNHPLSNGNKRMAFLTMYYFLYINNIDLNLSENEAYNLTKYIAKSDANKKDETMKYIKSKIKDKKNPQNKVKKVMHEFKEGKLHIGKSDKIVKNPKQAVAIALSQANASKKMANGGDIDSNSSYEAMLRKYDQLGAKLEDAIDEKNTNEVARLKNEMNALESKINNYERGGSSFTYSIGGL